MAQRLFRSHNTFAFGALSSDKISFSARIHIDLEVPHPFLYFDTILSRTTECRPRAQHLIFRGPLWPQGFTSLVRHTADSSRFTRSPNEARDYNKEANGRETPTAMCPRFLLSFSFSRNGAVSLKELRLIATQSELEVKCAIMKYFLNNLINFVYR